MDFGHQVNKDDCMNSGMDVVQNLKSAIGSLNNLSDAGSSRICAAATSAGGHAEKENGSWSLMSIVKGVPVVACSENSRGRQLELCNSTKLTEEAIELVKEIAHGYEVGYSPEKAEEGFGGTYFMANADGQRVAIFKPCDEEPFAPCNPKGFIGRSLGDPGLKPTVRVGEAALREVAASLLDQQKFAKVPTTVLMRASHPVFNYTPELTQQSSDSEEEEDRTTDRLSSTKNLVYGRDCGNRLETDSSCGEDVELPIKLGSMQEYVSHLCDTTEMGTSKFSVSDVQRIAILDIRLYNTDRHAGNILVKKIIPGISKGGNVNQFGESKYELIPIDHGFCLPEALEPPYFEWQHWSQVRMPLGDKEKEYIAKIDIEADKALLRKELPVLREESLRTMEVSTTLLKKCAEAGLSLHEIAEIMTRPLVGMDEEKSDLEKLCFETKEEIWIMPYIPSDSEDIESTCSIISSLNTPSKMVDELMFRMDDWKDIEITSTTANGGLQHSPFLPHLQQDQLEECLERLSIDDGNNTTSSDIVYIGLGMRNCYPRSMSMALPTSSICFQKRGANGAMTTQGAKIGHRNSNESPKKNENRVVYPPLIQGSMPGNEDRVFHDISDEQWPYFMKLLVHKIEDGLKKGKWTKSVKDNRSMSMNLGLSCPRF